MVDDVLAILMNSMMNSCLELKKLTLSEKKCGKIHVGKSKLNCHNLKVQEIISSDQDKYLGDQIYKNAKLKDTIEDRVSKVHAIISEMLF